MHVRAHAARSGLLVMIYMYGCNASTTAAVYGAAAACYILLCMLCVRYAMRVRLSLRCLYLLVRDAAYIRILNLV
jgi:hypothetical protein